MSIRPTSFAAHALLTALALALPACSTHTTDERGEPTSDAEGAFDFRISFEGGDLGRSCNYFGFSKCKGDLVCGGDSRCHDWRSDTTRWFKAAADCDPTKVDDCTPCANNVKEQFNGAWDRGRVDWDDAQWNFNWETNYPPSNREPDNVFEEHVQGFTRTYREPYRFVGSYSDEKGEAGNGGIFFVKRRDDGKKYLSHIFSARDRHPGGVSVIGKYVSFSDRDDWIRLIDMSQLDRDHLIEFPTNVKSKRTGGGHGIVKLAGDGYLLVVSPTGGDAGSERHVQFVHMSGALTRPFARSVGTWEYKQPASWSGQYKYSENLSVIPECGTGDIYTVHTGGPKVAGTSAGSGFYLLSKVVQRPGQGLGLEPIRAYHQEQEQKRCDHVAAASAWVDPSGAIDLMCHERAAYNFWADGNDDTMRFKYGTLGR